jgi:hypothetical protein
MTSKPKVVTWFKVYCVVLCIMYVAVAAASLIFFMVDPAALEMPALWARAIGVLCLLLGLGLFAACLLPLVIGPRPWLWTYDLVIICLGLSSPLFLPACVPLLIFWIKPETKNYFGRE